MAQVTVGKSANFPLPPRPRMNIRELEAMYASGNKKPLLDFIRAWEGIQKPDPNVPRENNFFEIAGYHGEPFRGAGWGNPQWWGGYCNHGNVLFPTWHRAYLLRLERALQSVPGCQDVMLPYWDETDEETARTGIPSIFLAKTIDLEDGRGLIPNPLYSYKFATAVFDNLTFPPIVSSQGDNVENPNPDYSKPKGYQTVRYPYSGLVGPEDLTQTEIHNAEIDKMGERQVREVLNLNVQGWLNAFIIHHDGTKIPTGTRQKYRDCLQAPNYTVFSNTTSAQQWNQEHFEGAVIPDPSKLPQLVVPLESPHNDIHLAIGGFAIPGLGDFDTIAGANGDMGENDTASFDPIFYLHHCWIDKVFWEWQVKHNSTQSLEIIPQYPGTNSVDAQGPTPGVAGNAWLTLDTPLAPFEFTSKEVVDITRLGYTYKELLGTPNTPLHDSPSPGAIPAKISGVNRGAIGGSFVLATYKQTPDGKRTLLGFESVLSRWHTSGCANCQTHLNVTAFVPLHGVTPEEASDPKNSFPVEILPRTDREGKKLIGAKPLPKPNVTIPGRG